MCETDQKIASAQAHRGYMQNFECFVQQTTDLATHILKKWSEINALEPHSPESLLYTDEF